MKLFIAAIALFLTACHAQPSNQPTDTAAYKPGKHHFKFTDQGMYYNGTQFHLGDTIQTYVKIFGPYSRDLGGGAYAWDSLGMMVTSPPLYRPRIAAIYWQISHAQDYNDHIKEFLIPEPLDIEKCGVLLTQNIRFRQVLRSTDCFYESVLHGLYKCGGYSETDTSKYDNIYYYLNSEIYDMGENKASYAVVSEFFVATDN
jgi:hypothetical protein